MNPAPVIQGQQSWQIVSDKVTAAITVQGGLLGPVQFRLGRRTISPFSVAPWAEEKLSPDMPPILKGLRGDFFCAPFGGNENEYDGEKHPPHGDSANSMWLQEDSQHNAGSRTWHWSLRTTTRPGRIDKFVRLNDGETNLYCRHVISQMEGRMSYGHHAMLKFPQGEGSGLVSSSRIRFGQVAPSPIESPANRGYQSLKPGASFTRLDRVPTAARSHADLSTYPARTGFEDLVMLVHQSESDFAWMAVTFPKERYVWFSLTNSRVLTGTILWISNEGRYYPPWNGRHTGALGGEDVTSYFHYGLAESARPNPVSRKGYATSVKLRKQTPFTVSYIMGVAAIPTGFGKVKSIKRSS